MSEPAVDPASDAIEALTGALVAALRACGGHRSSGQLERRPVAIGKALRELSFGARLVDTNSDTDADSSRDVGAAKLLLVRHQAGPWRIGSVEGLVSASDVVSSDPGGVTKRPAFVTDSSSSATSMSSRRSAPAAPVRARRRGSPFAF